MSHPAPNIPAGEAPNQAIRIDSDSNSTSASTSDSDDGGMQLDPPELEQIALLRRSGSLENVLSREYRHHLPLHHTHKYLLHTQPPIQDPDPIHTIFIPESYTYLTEIRRAVRQPKLRQYRP